ncbi:NADH dehydrogenase, subunit 5 [Lunatimonas lonarensis]|uniref:Probable inorganic carbon transporter subunit DabB n=1 Tax=Lunatimonas lonarensis TaxID=1232681 RepID=R7ZT52_9BACT|nr:proton-conducting transporter membrane subunit [Lunatimonas lonarensis]EON77262.1 NADH dehydrogenase, subunit 5 [Lunatimonas lonarensis]
MTENVLTLIALLSPAVYVAVAVTSWFQPGPSPKNVLFASRAASLTSILIIAFCAFFVVRDGMVASGLLGIKEVGLSIRLDSLSTLMLGMISLLGYIVIRFSRNYLDGDQRHGAFIGKMAATVATVQLLVISGNIGLLFISWVLTSVCLHRLLLFYPERPGAQVAAKKKFILARLGDGCLLIALALLYGEFGSGNLELIFEGLKNRIITDGGSLSIEFAALFLALAAVFKSAQFPTHGWLIEVMETPTPVSALLHAGLLNAGPFLIIRMAFVMDASTFAPILLLVLGAFTAVFASVAYMTQTSIKTALVYSSVGHMGFSLMVCGLGVYPAAMLHLVAHSFYKAHAFLSSGSVIDVLRASRVVAVTRTVTAMQIVAGILLALLLYAGFAMLWGIDPVQERSLVFVGAVIVLGLARIFSSALAQQLHTGLLARAVVLAVTVTISFFVLESTMQYLIGSQLPGLSVPGTGKTTGMAIALGGFATAVFLQLFSPFLIHNPAYQSMAVHFRNGFYANAWFDRIIQAFRIPSTDLGRVQPAPLPGASSHRSGRMDTLR